MPRRTDTASRTAAAAGSRQNGLEVEGKTAIQSKPARVTLNLPPAVMRDIERWAVDAAEELEVARVSVQDALRAMIQAALTDAKARSAALRGLRQEGK